MAGTYTVVYEEDKGFWGTKKRKKLLTKEQIKDLEDRADMKIISVDGKPYRTSTR